MTAHSFFSTWVFYAPEGAGICRMYELYVPVHRPRYGLDFVQRGPARSIRFTWMLYALKGRANPHVRSRVRAGFELLLFTIIVHGTFLSRFVSTTFVSLFSDSPLRQESRVTPSDF